MADVYSVLQGTGGALPCQGDKLQGTLGRLIVPTEDRVRIDGSDSARSKNVEKQCAWIFDRLREKGSVTLKEFQKEFSISPDEFPEKLKSDWSRNVRAMYTTLEKLSVPVKATSDQLRCEGAMEPRRYTTKRFRADEDFAAKQHIGELVATFLKDEKTGRISVFLGSGSTIYHVGLKMCEHGPYDQRLFWTVNIALAAAWCEVQPPPVDKISIPEAVLETKTFRFATMRPPDWSAAMVIVGADGCLYDEHKRTVTLYANEESVAKNTDLFVNAATHTVVVCLASRKIGADRNAGPIIHPPRKGVVRALVTDRRPHHDIADVLEKEEWTIVTEKEDWAKLPSPAPPVKS